MFYEMIKWVQTIGGIYPDPGPHTYAGPVVKSSALWAKLEIKIEPKLYQLRYEIHLITALVASYQSRHILCVFISGASTICIVPAKSCQGDSKYKTDHIL